MIALVLLGYLLPHFSGCGGLGRRGGGGPHGLDELNDVMWMRKMGG